MDSGKPPSCGVSGGREIRKAQATDEFLSKNVSFLRINYISGWMITHQTMLEIKPSELDKIETSLDGKDCRFTFITALSGRNKKR